ncbi:MULTISPECIES: IclR family transcriptional regulator [unclassified Schlesneria]|uniref:IclR family transcriptional regulator n=1 Tax=Schlesneria TaxID=656899 RepID=UPI00359F931F
MKNESKKSSASRRAISNNEETTVYNAPAVDKALDVLELLGDSSRGMSLTGIADALGRSKQELFRVLVCLQERGYLVRDSGQIYRLSTKLFELGSQHASTQMLVAHAMPHMERLARQLRESCHLNIVVQNRMLVVARAEGDSDVMLAVRIGATFELHRRISGLVALAMLPDHRRKDYWKQSGETASRIKMYEAHMAEIRKRGYSYEDSPIVVGVRDCAIAVMGGGSNLLGVLCVSHLCRRDEPVEQSALVEAAVQCARDISAEFGPVPESDNTSPSPGGSH